MAFHEVQFPTDIAFGAAGGPAYSTDIVETHGGYEQRNSNWAQARAVYQVAHGVKTEAQLAALIAFFRARKGRAYGFRFKDWADYRVSGQRIGTGDGAQTQFQLVKAYSSGGVTEMRSISKPVAGTVAVYVAGVVQNSGVAVNTANGMVTFTSAPANGAAITADFQFDVPVRFDSDHLSASLDADNSGSWRDIALVEVRV